MYFLKTSLLCRRPLKNIFRYAHVIADGRGRCNEYLNSNYQMNIGNLDPIIVFEKLNTTPFSELKFPPFCLKYSREDCVEHAVGIGINGSYPNAPNLIDVNSRKFQVLPSFVLTFNNIILGALTARKLMARKKCVYGEQFMSFSRPIKPEGVICHELNLVDIVGKVKGTVFVFTIRAWDEDQNEIFYLENHIYEVGGRNLGKTNILFATEPLVQPPQKKPDHVFEYELLPISPTFLNPTMDDMQRSIFDRNHWEQHHDFVRPQANCHGRYYLGVVLQQILAFFEGGDVRRVKKIKTRFSNIVKPGSTLMTKAWKMGERIHFETFDKETGQCVLQASYMDLKSE